MDFPFNREGKCDLIGTLPVYWSFEVGNKLLLLLSGIGLNEQKEITNKSLFGCDSISKNRSSANIYFPFQPTFGSINILLSPS